MEKYFVLFIDNDETAPDNIYLSSKQYYDENDFYERSGLSNTTILNFILKSEIDEQLNNEAV